MVPWVYDIAQQAVNSEIPFSRQSYSRSLSSCPTTGIAEGTAAYDGGILATCVRSTRADKWRALAIRRIASTHLVDRTIFFLARWVWYQRMQTNGYC